MCIIPLPPPLHWCIRYSPPGQTTWSGCWAASRSCGGSVHTRRICSGALQSNPTTPQKSGDSLPSVQVSGWAFAIHALGVRKSPSLHGPPLPHRLLHRWQKLEIGGLQQFLTDAGLGEQPAKEEVQRAMTDCLDCPICFNDIAIDPFSPPGWLRCAAGRRPAEVMSAAANFGSTSALGPCDWQRVPLPVVWQGNSLSGKGDVSARRMCHYRNRVGGWGSAFPIPQNEVM